MSRRLFTAIFIVVAFSSAGCGAEIHRGVILSETSFMMTATMPPTLTATPHPSETPPPPSPQPMAQGAAPAEGTTSAQLNVRAGPSTASNALGMIPPNTKVEIVGKDPAGNWWQINYPQAEDGKGWITAKYVTTAGTPEVPTIGGNSSDPQNGNVAVVQQQLNVRSGPGTGFNSLGRLNPQDVVTLIGKDPNGAWLQVNFAPGPDGKGWINAAFVQAQGVENLPIITEAGQIIGTGTPTSIRSSPTPTLVPAWEDHDSAASPAASVVFEPAGTQTLIYNGDISSPQGDSEDWIAFKPYGDVVFVSLTCMGNESMKIELLENNHPVDIDMVCDHPIEKVAVNPNSNYLIHLQEIPSADSLQYTDYTLIVKTRP